MRARRWMPMLIAGVAALCVSCTPDSAQESPDPVPPPEASKAPEARPAIGWPSYHGGASLDGAANFAFGSTLSVAWRYDAGARIANTPVSDANRRLIFVADDEGAVHALTWTGQRVWSRTFTQPGPGGRDMPEMFDAPLRIVEDMLIAAGAFGTLYAVALDDGDLRWQAETDSSILGSPNVITVNTDGKQQTRVVFVDQINGAVQCLDGITGKLLWSGKGIDRCDGSPAASDEFIVYGSCASAAHIFSPETGEMIREIDLGQDEQIAGGVVLLGDSIYASTRSGRFIHANARTGEILWSDHTSKEEALSTPAVDSNLVVFSDESAVTALDRATGALVWRQDLEDTPSSPISLRDVIAVAAGGTLNLLDRKTGRVIASHNVSDEITSPGVAGSYLLVGGGDGVVTAFAPA